MMARLALKGNGCSLCERARTAHEVVKFNRISITMMRPNEPLLKWKMQPETGFIAVTGSKCQC